MLGKFHIKVIVPKRFMPAASMDLSILCGEGSVTSTPPTEQIADIYTLSAIFTGDSDKFYYLKNNWNTVEGVEWTESIISIETEE